MKIAGGVAARLTDELLIFRLGALLGLPYYPGKVPLLCAIWRIPFSVEFGVVCLFFQEIYGLIAGVRVLRSLGGRKAKRWLGLPHGSVNPPE